MHLYIYLRLHLPEMRYMAAANQEQGSLCDIFQTNGSGLRTFPLLIFQAIICRKFFFFHLYMPCDGLVTWDDLRYSSHDSG